MDVVVALSVAGAPSAPLRNTYRIYAELRRAYPARYPIGDRGRHDRVVGEGGPIARLEAAMYAVAFGGRAPGDARRFAVHAYCGRGAE